MSGITAAGTPAPAPQRLVATLGPFGLFGRMLLLAIGEILIVPMPWTTTIIYTYLCDRLALPDGRRLRFAGKPGDIWYILIGIPLIMWVLQVVNILRIDFHDPRTFQAPWYFSLLSVLVELAMLYLGFLVMRWAIAKTTSEDGSVQLSFGGGVLAYFGWLLLVGLSFITIIGWAWAIKFYIRWMCRNVEGTVRFDFVGSGWSILWRSIAAWLGCIFIIPIPWMISWMTNWYFSNVVVTSGARA
jgi:hypothetical protein